MHIVMVVYEGMKARLRTV